MMKLAALLLLAASGSVVLTDDIYQLPAGGWRWVRFEIHHRPATVECRMETVGGGDARAELVSRQDLELIRENKAHDTLAYTDLASKAEFSQFIQEPGEYAVVIENPGGGPVAAHLTVGLKFGSNQRASRYLSPDRRLAVILISFAAFFTIITLSARALLRAMKKP